MTKPLWVKKEVVLAFHEEMLFEHGGTGGIRDEGLLDSALARPENLFVYENANVFELAAAYSFGIAKNHPFLDGNKRSAFLTGYVFLGLNGFTLIAPEAEATLQVQGLASGEISEKEYSEWLKKNSVPLDPRTEKATKARRNSKKKSS